MGHAIIQCSGGIRDALHRTQLRDKPYHVSSSGCSQSKDYQKERKLSQSQDSYTDPRGSTFSREGQHFTIAHHCHQGTGSLGKEDIGRQRWGLRIAELCPGVSRRVIMVLQTGDLIHGDSGLPQKSPPGLGQGT